MTNQYNGFGDSQTYETYVVSFGENQGTNVEFANGEVLVVYPNPTLGVLNVSEELNNVQLFDVTGRQVYFASVVVSTIDLSEIVAGTYFLVAEKNGELVSTKIVVK